MDPKFDLTIDAVDFEISVRKIRVGKTKSKLVSWFDLVLIVPSVAKVVLLGVRGVHVAIRSWILIDCHLLLVFNVWHGKS